MKLRLPNKLVAAIMAAVSPVLCSTISSATLGAAAVAVVVGQQTLGATQVNTPTQMNNQRCQDGLVITENGDLHRSFDGQGWTAMYANGLSGFGNITLYRNYYDGGNACFVWLEGNCSAYTGNISTTAGTYCTSGNANKGPNVLLVLGGNNTPSVDLGNVSSVTLGKSVLALGSSSVTVNNLTANEDSVIRAVSGVYATDYINSASAVTNNAEPFATADVTRTLTLKGASSIASSTLTDGVRLALAESSTETPTSLALSGNLSMAAGALSGTGSVNVAGGTTFANAFADGHSVSETTGFARTSFNLVAENSRNTLSVTVGDGLEYKQATGNVSEYDNVFSVGNRATVSATDVATEATRLGKSSYTTSVLSGGTYSVNETFDAANAGVTFSDGATLKLENGANVTSKLVRTNAATDALTLVVADGATASWAAAARINDGKGVQTVNVGEGATFTVGNSDPRYNVFNNSSDSAFELNMAAGSKVIASNSLVGWHNGNIGSQLVNIGKDAVLQMGTGSETTRLNHWFNSTVYALNGGSIDIKANNYLCFERRNGGKDNSIGTTTTAEKMSTITGDGFIEMGNNAATTSVTVDGTTYNGYKFDVQRGAFDYNETNTADLRISANFRNGSSNHDLLKTGNGILELTQSNTDYTGTFNVTAGGLRLTNAAARAKVNLVSGATLDLQNGAGLNVSNLNGTVTSSDAITVTGAITLGTNVRFDLANWGHESDDRYNIFTTTNASYLSGFTALGTSHFVSGQNASAFADWTLAQETVGDTTYFYITSAAGDLVWHGTEESHTWAGANWGDHKTISGANGAVLDSTASYKTVTLTDAPAASSISVQDNYTFEVESGVNAAVSGSLAISEGNTLTKTGEGTLSIAKANLSGKVSVNEGTLALSSVGSGNISLSHITGSGTLAVALDGTTATQGTASTLQLSDDFTGTLAFSGNLSTKTNFKNISGLYMQNGANLLTPDSTSSLTITIDKDITVADNANVALSAWGNTSTTAQTILSGVLSGGNNTTMWKEDGGTITLTGDYTGFAGSYNLNGGVLAMNVGADGKTISNTVSGSATLRKLGSGVMTLTSNMGSFTGTLDIAEGDVAISGTRSMAANVTGAGSLVVGSGSHLKANKGGEQSFNNVILKDGGKLEDNSAGESRVRNITNLTVIGNASLEQESWNTFWHITHLNKDAEQSAGTLTWNMDTNHWSNSVLYLDDSGTFDGTLEAKRTDGNTGNGAYQAYVQINNTNALQSAVLNLNGADANRVVSLALHANTVNMAGLQGTANSIVFVGEADATQGSGSSQRGTIAPTSAEGESSTLVLNVGENKNHNYQGKLLSGISIQKDGAGEQQLTGDLSAFNGDLTVNAGTLTITGTSLPQADEGTRGALTLNGGTLKVGSGDGVQTSLSSFSSVTMAGGVLHYNNKQDTLHNVTAKADTTSRIFSFDMGAKDDGCKLTLDGTTTLNGNLTLHNYWNAAFEVEKLTGSGTFKLTGADADGNVATTTAQDGELTINSLEGFAGNMDFDSTGARATINTGVASVAMNTLSVHHGAQVTINAYSENDTVGTLSGNNLTLDGASSLTFNGGSNTFTTMGVADNGTSDANVIVNLTSGSELKITNNVVFAAHGEKVNISDTSKLNIAYRGLTVESIDGTQTATFSVPVGTHSDNYYTFNDNGQGIYLIENAKATYSKGGTVTTKHSNSIVRNSGTSELTVSNNANTLVGVHAESGAVKVQNAASSKSTLKSIKAEGGDVTLLDLGADASLSLSELVIGNSKTVTALTEGTSVNQTESNVAAISIADGGTLTAGSGATLNANLTMQSGSTLDVQQGGLSLGCSLTLNNGEKFVLHDATVTEGKLENYILYTGVDSFVLNGATITDMGWYDAKDVRLDRNIISSITADGELLDLANHSYVFGFWNGTVSLAESTVPEPTTTTLSLLALAALAARRRRK